jgi:hypothetical protein
MAIYIITDPIKEKENQYKIGRTRKYRNGILTTYTRYLGNPIIKFYKLVPMMSDYTVVEKNILTLLKGYRIKNNNGNMSEWVKLPLTDILQVIKEVFDDLSDDSDASYEFDSNEENNHEDEIEVEEKKYEFLVYKKYIEQQTQCNKCEKKFERMIDLLSYINRKYPCDYDKEILACRRCGKVFENNVTLNYHLKKQSCIDKRHILDLELEIQKEKTKQARIYNS